MSEVSSVAQTLAEYFIPGLHHRQIHRHVCLGPGVGLHIYMLRPKKLLRPFDSKVLYNVGILTSAVVALLRIALGIFIGKDGTLCFQDRLTRIIFRCDQYYFVLLALNLIYNRVINFRVTLHQIFHAHLIYSTFFLWNLFYRASVDAGRLQIRSQTRLSRYSLLYPHQ